MSVEYKFSDEEIIRVVNRILGQVSDKKSEILQRSDIRKTLDVENGVWHELSPDGDPDAIGFGFVVMDAEDADDKKPFVTAIKVSKNNWNRDPKGYAMGIVSVVSRGMNAMHEEMHETKKNQMKRIMDLHI